MTPNASRRSGGFAGYALRRFTAVALGAGFFVSPSHGGWRGDTVASPSDRIPVTVDGMYLFNDATMGLSDGREIVGLFAGVKSDSIGIWQPGRVNWFGQDQVNVLRVNYHAEPGTPALCGAIVGGYLGLVIGYLTSEQPSTSSISDRFGYPHPGQSSPFLIAGAGAVVGSMLTYLIASEIESELRLDLSGSPEAKQRELQQLDGSALQSEPPTIHFRISAGWTQFKTQSPPHLVSGWDWQGGWERGSFTVFRRGSATYSIAPWIEAGLGIVNFSEPRLESFGLLTCEQSSNNMLYCIAGQLKPLIAVLPSGISWDIGVGFGLATTDYKSSVVRQGSYSWETGGYQPDSVLASQVIDSRTLGITLSTGISLYPDDYFSVGFVVDYSVAPFITVDAVPDLGLESRKLGNLCLAIEIGFHF